MIRLYVKTHNKTGLKYFGKTVYDPFKYRGSGRYWLRHIREHGNDVTTVLLAEFEDAEHCRMFALAFSQVHDIVASEDWANLREENGHDGAPVGHTGHVFTEEQLQKISAASLVSWQDGDFRARVCAAQKAAWTEDRKKKQREDSAAAWTEDRRATHSKRMSELAAELPPNVRTFIAQASAPKSEDHKANISTALKGLAKSPTHKAQLAWTRLKKSNPQLTSYEDFVSDCIRLSEDGLSKNAIATSMGVSWTAVNSALNTHPNKGNNTT